MTELREALAKFIHEDFWANWMKYQFTKTKTMWRTGRESVEADPRYEHERDEYNVEVIEHELVERWKRQMNTSYEDLPEEEKKSDREIADKLLELINKYLDENGVSF